MPIKTLKKVKVALSSIQFILSHPLNRERRVKALRRWFSWQLGSRLVPGPVVVPFVNDSKLLISPGMTGATGNIYCGLHEFESMAFVLHLLHPNDLFLDIGVNVGSYSILSASIGAKCRSFEPVPATFKHLLKNIRLNGFEKLIDAYNIAVSSRTGEVKITTEYDTTNHIVGNEEEEIDHEKVTKVPAQTLNDITSNLDPLLIKVDVESHDMQVIEGAGRTLCKNSLLAIILEVNHAESHKQMLDQGFRPYKYLPFDRKLTISSAHLDGSNTLYIRDDKVVSARLNSAPYIHILENKI